MPHVKYVHIFDPDMVRSMLLVEGKSICEAAHILGVPYNCLLNQVKKLVREGIISEDEFARINDNKTRHHYKREEKVDIVQKVIAHGTIAVAKDYGIHPGQLRAWKSAYLKGELDYDVKRGRKPNRD